MSIQQQFPHQQYYKFNNGVQMPSIGLGCYMGASGGGQAAETMVKTALKLGYRHLDTAARYTNEEQVGKAMKASGIPRSEIFLTTKLAHNDHARVQEAFDESLKRLDTEYIDLYLMHWPNARKEDGTWYGPLESPTFVETWLAMEKLLDAGKVRAIGVSNFSVKLLEILLSQCNVVPAVNQVEMHPLYPQFALIDYCAKKGIHMTAYSPLGNATWAWWDDASLKQIAEKHGVGAAQILLSWGLQRGISIIPKSQHEARLKQNLELVRLEEEDMQTLNCFHKEPGMHRNLLMAHKAIDGKIFGWTFEEMGWNLDKEARVIAN